MNSSRQKENQILIKIETENNTMNSKIKNKYLSLNLIKIFYNNLI
jgi:hypothetical protein